MGNAAVHPGRAVSILLIEDNPLDVSLFREYLNEARDTEFRLVSAERLRKGIELLEREDIDVVFLDFLLPDSQDGLHSLDRLLKTAPLVPVVLLTSLDDDEVGVRAVQAGAQDYLVKEQISARNIWQALRYAIERKRIEEQLIAQRRLEVRLQQAQRAESLAVLAGGVAHDYNNLLTGILGNAALALAELPPESPVAPLILEVQTAAERATRLTGQMLAYSGKATLSLEAVDLGPMIRGMESLFNASVARNVSLTCSLPDAPVPVLGDAARLRQVLANLVTNACEAVGEAGGEVNVTVATIRLDRPLEMQHSYIRMDLPVGTYVRLSVSDNGCGMTPEVLERMFDPFFTTKFVGRGLGLAGVLGIVKAHNGGIRAESRPAIGTKVTVYLPAARETQPTDVPPSPAPDDKLEGVLTGGILVVDDEELVISINRRVLQKQGFTVYAAKTVAEAMASLREHPGGIRVTVLDLSVSGRDLATILPVMREAYPGMRFVVCTSIGSEESERNLRKLPGVALIRKPYVPDALIGSILSLL